jgi:hypothetical protein
MRQQHDCTELQQTSTRGTLRSALQQLTAALLAIHQT